MARGIVQVPDVWTSISMYERMNFCMHVFVCAVFLFPRGLVYPRDEGSGLNPTEDVGVWEPDFSHFGYLNHPGIRVVYMDGSRNRGMVVLDHLGMHLPSRVSWIRKSQL